MALDDATGTQPCASAHLASPFCAFLGAAHWLLLLSAVVLLIWALREGIVFPPVKEQVHLVSLFGVPAAVICGLLAYSCRQAQRALDAGKMSAAIGYLLLVLVPLAVGVGVFCYVAWFAR
jgi:hypothetical protein